MNKIETGIQYSIPVADKDIDQNWQQKCEIPVAYSELRIQGIKPIVRLRFIVDPGKPSGLDILAGDGDLEIAGCRIRAQMIHRLETSQELLQRPDPPPGLVLLIQAISKYFAPHNEFNVQLYR